MNAKDFAGLDDLRGWLQSKGFKVYADNLSREWNLCNWYACRKISADCRECETNEGKRMQVVVTPYCMMLPNNDGTHTQRDSVEIAITGEAKAAWFKLMAYSLSHDELRDRMDEIEGRLASAWNALA